MRDTAYGLPADSTAMTAWTRRTGIPAARACISASARMSLGTYAVGIDPEAEHDARISMLVSREPAFMSVFKNFMGFFISCILFGSHRR